jgi:hypothetical protein
MSGMTDIMLPASEIAPFRLGAGSTGASTFAQEIALGSDERFGIARPPE